MCALKCERHCSETLNVCARSYLAERESAKIGVVLPRTVQQWYDANALCGVAAESRHGGGPATCTATVNPHESSAGECGSQFQLGTAGLSGNWPQSRWAWAFLQRRAASGLSALLPRCGSPGRLLGFSEPQVPHLPNENKTTYFRDDQEQDPRQRAPAASRPGSQFTVAARKHGAAGCLFFR